MAISWGAAKQALSRRDVQRLVMSTTAGVETTPDFTKAALACNELLSQMAGRMNNSSALQSDQAAAQRLSAARWLQPVSQSTSHDNDQLLRLLAKHKITRLTLRDLHSFCANLDDTKRIQQATFLHREVPVRFAQRAMELRNLPYGLSDKQPVMEAAGWYADIVQKLVEFPVPTTVDQELEFASFLAGVLLDHSCVPQALSKGVLELRSSGALIDRHRIDKILDNFFISRISLRFLVEHYVASRRNREGFSGVIQSECSPMEVAHKAAADIERLCRTHMGASPEIQIYGCPSDTFTYIPSHLYYIMCELLKNSCRASVEHSRTKGLPGPEGHDAQSLPPVKVIVARGKEDMTIKVADEAGGIKRSHLQHIWSYFFSTAPTPSAEQFREAPLDHLPGTSRRLVSPSDTEDMQVVSAQAAKYAFAGYGMGLPLSRLYAQHFGGSLKLRPMEGFGTDAYLHLHRLRTNNCERLPAALDQTLEKMGEDGRMATGAAMAWKAPRANDWEARQMLRQMYSKPEAESA